MGRRRVQPNGRQRRQGGLRRHARCRTATTRSHARSARRAQGAHALGIVGPACARRTRACDPCVHAAASAADSAHQPRRDRRTAVHLRACRVNPCLQRRIPAPLRSIRLAKSPAGRPALLPRQSTVPWPVGLVPQFPRHVTPGKLQNRDRPPVLLLVGQSRLCACSAAVLLWIATLRAASMREHRSNHIRIDFQVAFHMLHIRGRAHEPAAELVGMRGLVCPPSHIHIPGPLFAALQPAGRPVGLCEAS